MSKKQIDLESLITHELTIDRWEEAFELVENKKAIKVVLIPVD